MKGFKDYKENILPYIKSIKMHVIIGYILLFPAFISFFYCCSPKLNSSGRPLPTEIMRGFTYFFTAPSADDYFPIYFGLMALAGAYLIKSQKR